MSVPFRAQQGGLFGSGVYITPSVDYAGIIDSVAGGASSLIRQTYMRKLAEQDQAKQDAEVQYRHTQDTKRDAFEREKFDREMAMREHESATRDEGQRRSDLLAGITPGKDELKAVPGGTAPIAAPVVSPIQRAMKFDPSALQGTMPPVGQTPSGEQSTMNVPTSTTATEHTPETYDPTKNAAYIRSTETARIRGEVSAENQAKRVAAQQAGREFAAKAAQELARLKADLSAQHTGIRGAMTGNALELARQRAAEGLVSQTSGSYDDAVDVLQNSTEGEGLRKLGVEPRHLMYAHSKFVASATGQAMRAQTATGAPPEEAVNQVNTTRQLVAGSTKKAKPAAPATPAAETPKAATPATPKLVAPKAADTESALSDADLWEQKVKEGMPKDKATAYVKNRKKK